MEQAKLWTVYSRPIHTQVSRDITIDKSTSTTRRTTIPGLQQGPAKIAETETEPINKQWIVWTIPVCRKQLSCCLRINVSKRCGFWTKRHTPMRVPSLCSSTATRYSFITFGKHAVNPKELSGSNHHSKLTRKLLPLRARSSTRRLHIVVCLQKACCKHATT